jgi:hypothetical protein
MTISLGLMIGSLSIAVGIHRIDIRVYVAALDLDTGSVKKIWSWFLSVASARFSKYQRF